MVTVPMVALSPEVFPTPSPYTLANNPFIDHTSHYIALVCHLFLVGTLCDNPPSFWWDLGYSDQIGAIPPEPMAQDVLGEAFGQWDFPEQAAVAMVLGEVWQDGYILGYFQLIKEIRTKMGYLVILRTWCLISKMYVCVF